MIRLGQKARLAENPIRSGLRMVGNDHGAVSGHRFGKRNAESFTDRRRGEHACGAYVVGDVIGLLQDAEKMAGSTRFSPLT